MHTAFGQKIHEIKTDLLLPFVPGAHLAYEFIPQKRLGVELEARYRWDVDGFYDRPNSCGGCNELTRVGQKVLTLTLNAKFYFLKNKAGSGAYAGAYMREDWQISRRDLAYEYFYIPEYFDGKAGPSQSRSLRSGVGVLAGYKFVLRQRWTVEASLGIDKNYRWLFGERSKGEELAGIPSLKAGYRL